MNSTFLTEDFLLYNETARRLYHDYAADMPIIDYHNHLPPDQIACNKQFEDLTEIWLKGDHYKWRAMRANGVPEEYITGQVDSYTKFYKWAETVPYTFRNPLYHWTHMELLNPFGIKQLLTPYSAKTIFDTCNEKLKQPEFSTQGILNHFKVTHLCTTDDPSDDLKYHKDLQASNFETPVYPTFRADKGIYVDDPAEFNAWLHKIEAVNDKNIKSYTDYLEALKMRHDFFHKMGGRLSDQGMNTFYAAAYTEKEIEKLFQQLRKGKALNDLEKVQFASAVGYEIAVMNWEKGWTQQFHVGAIRNNNSGIIKAIGKDAGCDSIGDWNHAPAMSRFFNRLNSEGKLAKTIVYNLNPRDNELFATMVGNFNDGTVPGKMQYGAAWWFLDQKDGIIKQFDCLSNHGLLSRFVGMLTDSRSFLSFSRHEYFRRILCNLLGKEMEDGELPNDVNWIGQMIQDICYNNAARYFEFEAKVQA